MEQNQERGPLGNLKPKTAFKAGLFAGIAIMFVVGFFILLGMMLNDKDKNNNNDNDNNNAPVVADDQGNTAPIQLQAVDKNKDWIRGDKNAKVSIVEFSDIDCPFCARYHDTMNQLIEKYDGKINWVYRHFPLTSLHPDAFKKAEASECVGELGGNDKFWEYLDKLFADDETAAELGDIASSIGINKGKFQDCLDSGKYTSKVQNYSSQAQAAGALVLRHLVNRGQGAALRTGFLSARYDYIFYTDGDNQYDVLEFSPYLKFLENYDILNGYAIKKAVTPRRQLQSMVFNTLVNILFLQKFRDVNCSIKMYKRAVVGSMVIQCASAFIDAEILIKAKRLGFKIYDVPVTHYERLNGLASGSKFNVIWGTVKDMVKFGLGLL